LLTVAALRGECHRLGLRDVQIIGGAARLGPLQLKVSEMMRLKRLSRTAIYKEDAGQLVVPIARGVEPATFLVGFLREIVPTADAESAGGN
jgi:hypothetical protein